MNTTLNKTSSELKADIVAELQFDPSVDESRIGVQVKDGAVTLTGSVSKYSEKLSAVRAVKRVAGVKAVADDIIVRFPSTQPTDSDIALAAAHHLDWNPSVPKGSVQATVRDGEVTLEGEVEWWFQKEAAEKTVRILKGVKGVFNRIQIRVKATSGEVKSAIRSAFERSALLDSARIEVETSAHDVVLRGKVRSYAERDEAERAAWASPGVTSVQNKIKVVW